MEEHIMQQTTSEQKPQWISVSEIQKEYLPISKKAIRRMLKQNLDIARTGGKKNPSGRNTVRSVSTL